jgi:hypothetical protein
MVDVDLDVTDFERAGLPSSHVLGESSLHASESETHVELSESLAFSDGPSVEVYAQLSLKKLDARGASRSETHVLVTLEASEKISAALKETTPRIGSCRAEGWISHRTRSAWIATSQLTPSRSLLSRMTTLITVSLKSRQNTSTGASKKGLEVYCLTRVLKTISSITTED